MLNFINTFLFNKNQSLWNGISKTDSGYGQLQGFT